MPIYRSLFKFNKKEAGVIFQEKIYSRSLFPFVFITTKLPQGLSCGKLLVIISRKVCNSVGRSLLRRRIKNIFFSKQLYKHQYSTAVVCKPGAANLDFAQIEALLEKYFSKLMSTSLEIK